MFEDLIKEKKVPIEKQIERCPYCGSYIIQKSNRVFTIDDRWTQKIVCRICTKTWTVLYNEDQSPARILLKEDLGD